MTSPPKSSTVIVGLICLKLLLLYSYYSTDFEVHRNWLAVTHSLPLSQWYTDCTSQWTLDYPPLFAWGEWLLSWPASVFEPSMLTVQSEPYVSFRARIFQRLSVIVSDLSLLIGSWRVAKWLQRSSSFLGRRSSSLFVVGATLLLANPGLILVDHVHFQYNGFLTGLLLLSIVAVMEGRLLQAAFWYAVLVCFKHIYIYLAPAYIAYFLRNFCFTDRSRRWNWKLLVRSFSFPRCFKLIFVLGSVCSLTFGPFLYIGQISQVISRLFPFKRGLTHAYWAPNFWAFYNSFDFALSVIWKQLGWLKSSESPSYTSGLVQEYEHLILPSVSPLTTLLLTVMVMSPFCVLVGWKPARGVTHLRLLVLCAFASYMFGWHVHEKAVLLLGAPSALLALTNWKYVRYFLLLSCIGHCSLFPLFFTELESPVKYILTLGYFLFSLVGFNAVYQIKRNTFTFLNRLDWIYLFGFLLLEAYKSLVHGLLGMDIRFPFLPLLFTSCYCAIGMAYCFLLLCWRFLCDETELDVSYLKKRWAEQQRKMKEQLITENMESWQEQLLKDGKASGLRFVGGLDISTPDGDELNACVCLSVLSFPELEVVKTVCEAVIIEQPYIAGFLAFREWEPMIGLVRQFIRQHPSIAPQVLLVDGNGLLHPREFGLACQIGVTLDLPTVGVAKNLHLVDGLVRDAARYEEELISVGQSLPLESSSGRVLGVAVKTSPSTRKPVFVSVGHRIGLPAAIALVILCSKYRVPEPIRHADQTSREMVRTGFEDRG